MAVGFNDRTYRKSFDRDQPAMASDKIDKFIAQWRMGYPPEDFTELIESGRVKFIGGDG